MIMEIMEKENQGERENQGEFTLFLGVENL
jgi:hypothetical protein